MDGRRWLEGGRITKRMRSQRRGPGVLGVVDGSLDLGWMNMRLGEGSGVVVVANTSSVKEASVFW